MIKPLRKRHLQAWALLAMLLPLGIISAWLAIPKPVHNNLLQPPVGKALPVVVKTFKKTNYIVNLRSNADSSALQLEWINNTALTISSALIYQKFDADSSNDMHEADLIGRLDARGIFYFPLKNTHVYKKVHFIIYDIIHHQVIEQIDF